MADVELKGSTNRIKNCASDLLSLIGDDHVMDDNESWELMRRELRLKSTFLYCDFNRVVSCTPEDQRNTLVELVNKLFSSIEELEGVIRVRNIKLTQGPQTEIAAILKEVIALLP